MPEPTAEELAAHSQVVGEVRDIAQKLWGVPDCENCGAQEGCSIFQIFGLESIKAGNPDVQGCSSYEPIGGEDAAE